MQKKKEKRRLEAFRLPMWLSDALARHCKRCLVYKGQLVAAYIEEGLRSDGTDLKKPCLTAKP